MARKPFFSGNYGSALARVDTRPIIEAGRAQGQMFANVGSQIGGMIKEYGLNKEKQKKNQAFIKGQSNLLDMLSEQDPEQADRYAIMKEQLNNPDVSLTERTELGKQLMQNVTLSNQMQNQMLNRKTQEQALGLARKTEDLTVENLKLGNRQKELGTLLGEISLEELKAIKDEKTRVALLTLKERGKDLLLGDEKRELESAEMANRAELLPSETAAKKAQFGAVPGQVERQEELSELQVKAAKRADTSADLLLQAFGGAEGKAEFDYKGAKLSRKNLKKGLEYLDARIDYTNYLSTAKDVPIDTKKQYASLVSHSGKIVDTLVEDPDTGNQITFQEYMEKANNDPDLYPLTGAGSGAAGVLYGNFQNAQKQIIDFGKTIQVQVDDGQGAGDSLAPTGSPINVSNMQPQQAMQVLQDRIGQIRRQLPQLSAQQQQLGQPGQMATTAFDTSPFGNINTPLAVRPQTISDVQNSSIPQQRLDLMAELEQLEAKRQELQNQFGVR